MIAANGGAAANGGGSGGGGRVAIYYATLNGFDLDNHVTAHGGNGGAQAGAVETVYAKRGTDLGRLMLTSHGKPAGAWTPPRAAERQRLRGG